MEGAAFSVAYDGNPYISYEWLQPITTQINPDARTNIADIPFTIIFRMGQEVCCFLIRLYMRPLPHS